MATSGSIKDEEDGRPFPEDLAMDILQRLPVVSLLRFECISKNWYTLIKSPVFARIHINYNNKKNKSRPRILIYDRTSNGAYFFDPLDNSIPPITFISFPDDNYKAKRLLEIPDYLQKFKSLSDVMGPVDGLFLLKKDNFPYEDVRLAMWNPATREVIPLPEFQFQDQPPHYSKNMQFGFGLDPVTNDYKVVWFCMYQDEGTVGFNYDGRWDPRVYAAVYSCFSDSWRVLEKKHEMVNSDPYYIGDNDTAYLDGTYFWLQRGNGEGDKAVVFSFDFSNEVFTEIPCPDVPINAVKSLILLDDTLTICTIDVETYTFHLWFMIQPRVWNKVFTFRGLSHGNNNPWPRCCGFWDSSTVIFQIKKGWLVSYDIRTEETRHLGYGHRDYMFSVMYYKESLVRIKRGNGELSHSSLPDFFDSPLHLPSEVCDLDDLLDTSWLYQ